MTRPSPVPRAAERLPASRIDAGGLAGAVRGFLARIEAWCERDRQRRALALLDDRQLKDVGLSRADVERVSRKSLWGH